MQGRSPNGDCPINRLRCLPRLMGQSPAGTAPPAGFLVGASARAAPLARRPPGLEQPARRGEVGVDLVLDHVQLVLDQTLAVADVLVPDRASHGGPAVKAMGEQRISECEPHPLTMLRRWR